MLSKFTGKVVKRNGVNESEILEYLGDLPENDVHLPMLVRQMQTPVGIVPLVGAGMSAPFDFPQWTKFLQDLAKRVGKSAAIDELMAAGKYEEAAEDLISALQKTKFQDLIEHYFGDQVLAGKQLTGAITHVPYLNRGPVITTNFDRLLERTFQLADCPFELVVWHSKVNLAIRAFEEDRPVLLKIHGDWQDSEDRVLTLTEYRENYGDPDCAINFSLPLPQLFKLLAIRPLLFLGASLNQDRTVSILKRVAQDLPSSRHYAVVEKPAAEAECQKRAEYLAAHNIRPIWYPTGRHDTIERLLAYLREQAPESLRRSALKSAGKPQIARPDMIPKPLSSFIGREQECKELRALVMANRLLTITGPPGSGKTRVALEVARSLQTEFDAVWFVELSQLQEPALVPQRVAAILGIREQASRPPTEVIADFLKSGKYLLALDNCEHLIEACASLVDYLLRECPPLKILTTSRATLNLGGEHVFIIPPLALPEAALTADPAGLLAFDSVTLLLDRARALSNFRITPENAGAVASLCRGLEGMPLAIELAAAQLGVLTVHQILEHMNQSLELLAGGIGGTTERQWATLKEAINLSYGMLNAEQSIFFLRLSIFHRGWTWEAAVEICREKPQNEFDVLRLMNQLHRMSLIVVEEKAGQKRFRLLDSIREFARDRLIEAGEENSLVPRHAAWFLQLAEKAAPEFLKRNQKQWLDTLAIEVDNLRAAILWAVTVRQAESALRLTASLWRLMEIRGFYREGIDRLKTVLEMPETMTYPELRSKAMSGLGMLLYRQGDLINSEGYFKQSLEIERECNNQLGIANALNDLGNVRHVKGDFEAARSLFVESLEIERKSGTPRGVAVALFNLGKTARRAGLTDDAAGLLCDSLKSFVDEGNLREAAFPLNELAKIELTLGNLDESAKYAQRSLEIRTQLADQKGVSETMRTLGRISIKQGDLNRANKLFGESLELARGVNDLLGIAELLEQFAFLHALQQELESCARLCSVAEKLRDQMHAALSPGERAERDSYLDAARAVLGGVDFAKNWETGKSLAVTDAVELAVRPRGKNAGVQ